MRTQRAWILAALIGSLGLATMPVTTEAGHRHRDHRGRVVVRHRTRPVHHRPTVIRVNPVRDCFPPPVIVRPWHAVAPRVTVFDDDFYFHAGLNVYLGGLAFHLDLGDAPPYGYVYYDPYCDEEFWSVEAYHRHLRRHRHPVLLRVIEFGDGDACGPWRDRGFDHEDDHGRRHRDR